MQDISVSATYISELLPLHTASLCTCCSLKFLTKLIFLQGHNLPEDSSQTVSCSQNVSPWILPLHSSHLNVPHVPFLSLFSVKWGKQPLNFTMTSYRCTARRWSYITLWRYASHGEQTDKGRKYDKEDGTLPPARHPPANLPRQSQGLISCGETEASLLT